MSLSYSAIMSVSRTEPDYLDNGIVVIGISSNNDIGHFFIDIWDWDAGEMGEYKKSPKTRITLTDEPEFNELIITYKSNPREFDALLTSSDLLIENKSAIGVFYHALAETLLVSIKNQKEESR